MPAWSRRWLLPLAACALLAAACGDDKKGACVPRASPQSCGDDYTSGQCDMLNGDFYPGRTCEELRR